MPGGPPGNENLLTLVRVGRNHSWTAAPWLLLCDGNVHSHEKSPLSAGFFSLGARPDHGNAFGQINIPNACDAARWVQHCDVVHCRNAVRQCAALQCCVRYEHLR